MRSYTGLVSVLESFAQQDNRIKVIRNENNLGFVASLNKGLSFCSGEFIARTDSDDIVNLDWIETILQYMLEDNSIVAMGGHLEILMSKDATGNLSKYCNNGDIWHAPLTHDEIITEMFFRNPIHNNCMIMRSDIYHKYNLTFDNNYIHAEDFKFWFEVSKLGKIVNIDKVLVKYRVHSHQTSSLYRKIQNSTAIRIRREIIDYYFSDEKNNINFMGEITTKHIEHILSKGKEKEFNQRLIYELYCSLSKYDLYSFKMFLFKHMHIFSLKQKIKIIKRFIRPYKYSKNL
ncbi:UDP-GlcNAc--lipooligosaccharide N-acetylglucosamine glycosyltransferase [Canicola haemoglobinophilus]|uniref:UDP-GlcNAc--lipooligosaccharide N-acetylglucosamine glycosyltransferase n=1 Tax=Canicola haemoglobinophilus TaxID=733 RepID=A0AB38H7C6_9PAST|nr:glycosyltransferase [Canicola haemoglobinophilus]STO55546.1 UDP-GlcNAc--lipooligosaccharide N-acetylglucosamine glycosyltransferase [Canicola haemoglobinophilus]STO67873.1 UDP-GlcNAc--lipooligosaccharide N-acetylglucosamine glycosyltransferase [Canicola haemoglobinophilus]